MSPHLNPFATVLFISGIASLLMAIVLIQRPMKAVKWFAMLMICITIWAVCYAYELSSVTLTQMLFWIRLEYIGISFLPAMWIVFVIKFVHKESWLTRRNYALIFSFPVLALLFIWTNELHHIHYEAVSLDDSGPFPLLAIDPGPWYHVHTVYFYFVLAWGIYLLFRAYKKSGPVYRKQNALIIAAAFFPWAINLLYLIGFRPFGHIDLTPYAFIATSITIGFGLLRYKLFDVLPMARDKIIEGIKEGILVLDGEKRIVDINQTMITVLTPHSNQLIGKSLDEIIPREYPFHNQINRNKDGRTELRLNSHGREYFFEVEITPLRNPDETLMGTLLVFWDVTEFKTIEKRLTDQATELAELNNIKDRFFSIIAHDLRSPLVNLVNILTMAENKTLTEEEFREFIPLLSKNVESTGTLLDNLLHWSQSQLGGEQVFRELFDLKSIVSRQLALMERKAADKKINIRDDVNSGTFVYADRNMIDLVIRNLMGNAIKFCSAGDTITISARMLENETTLSVTDTGKGIPEENISRLFTLEPFTTPGTQNEKGTGLGLNLCHEFIVKNGGKIWVESKPGKGSTFSFSLKNSAG